MNTNKKVIAYLHTHWDHEWYRTAAQFNLRLIQVFDKVLSGLVKNDFPSFYFDGQVLALLNYLKFRPEKTELVKKLIKQKKLYIGPFFTSVDTFLPCACALYKNAELGIKIAREFGQKEFIGYICDSFGHSSSIFKILKACKVKNAIVWRGAGDVSSDFIVNGIKTVRLIQGYYHQPDEDLKKTLNSIAQYSSGLILLPLGADHMAPFENTKQLISSIQGYKIKLQSPFDYFKKASFKNSFNNELLDNSNSYILPGVRTIRTNEKAKNARLEWNLYNCAMVFNFFMDAKYNTELEFAQMELLKNHAHDSIYGCVIDEVSQTVRYRQMVVEKTTDEIIKNLFEDFKNKYLINETPKDGQYAGVFNFSAYNQANFAKIVTDKKIKYAQKIRKFNSVSNEILCNIYKNPMTEDFHEFYEYLIEIPEIKGFSFKNFKLAPIEKKQIAGDDFIENPCLKLFVLNNKIWVLNKKTGEIFENFIELQLIKDNGDSYNFAPAEKPHILKLVRSRKKTDGIIQSVLELKFEKNIVLNVSLKNNSELFEIEAVFKNKTKNSNLQIVINTKKPVFKTLAGNPEGAIERTHNPDYCLFDNLPVKDKTELKTNNFPMQKFVFTNNTAVFAVGLYDYEVYKNSIKVSLLRSTGIISNPKNPARGAPAGPPILCPGMQCINESFNFKLAVGFFENSIDVQTLKRFADELFEPCTGVLGEFKIKDKTMLKNPQNKEFAGICIKTHQGIFL